ncbi:MAG TPA: alpha/beta hydrolase [Xanthobacteraceae bacterium]|jgi:pimeloyl-ACP methyl ester carboxylesterase
MSEISRHTDAGLSYLKGEGAAATPIVLLHGIGSNACSFVPLMRAFEGRHPVLAWDAPGYGASAPLAVHWPDASDYATVLNRWLDQLEISRCVVAGHSLGALIAARFARTSPRRVAALLLLSPALGHGVAKGDPLPDAVAARLTELDRLGPEKFAAARAPSLLADPAGRPDVLQAVERAMADVRRPGYDQAARMLAGGRLLDDAANILVPTAVLVGTQDRITPPASARRVFDALPGASQRHVYRDIADAGHALCQEQPDAVARAITEMVENRANVHA